MKKRYLVLLLCVLLIGGCFLYHPREETVEEPLYVLYFRERDLTAAAGEGVLRREAADLKDTTGMTTDEIAEALVIELLAGPADDTLRRTISAGTTLNSLRIERTRAIVDLSATYGLLSGIELTMADQSIALTLTQLPEVLSVEILVMGENLAYRDRQIFTGRDVLLAPAGDVVSTVTAELYFLTEDGNLQAVKQDLDLYEGDTQVSAVVKALESGPVEKGLVTAMPEGFRTRAVWLEDRVCYVNLSSHLAELLPEDVQIDVTLQALAGSLCSLDSVVEVRFLVDGEYADYYGTAYIAKAYTE
jgi:germination protein M